MSLGHIPIVVMDSRGTSRINVRSVAFTAGWPSPAVTFAKYETAEVCVGRALLCCKTDC